MSERDPMLDAILCAECPKEFIPKKPGQTTCGTHSCAGGQGARARKYSKATPASRREFNKNTSKVMPKRKDGKA